MPRFSKTLVPEPIYSLWQSITVGDVELVCTAVSWNNATWSYAYSFCPVQLMHVRLPGDSPFGVKPSLEQFAVEEFQCFGDSGEYLEQNLYNSCYWKHLTQPVAA